MCYPIAELGDVFPRSRSVRWTWPVLKPLNLRPLNNSGYSNCNFATLILKIQHNLTIRHSNQPWLAFFSCQDPQVTIQPWLGDRSMLAMICHDWWFTDPSEKYEFVGWDDEIPNIWKNKKRSKPPTSMPWFSMNNQYSPWLTHHSQTPRLPHGPPVSRFTLRHGVSFSRSEFVEVIQRDAGIQLQRLGAMLFGEPRRLGAAVAHGIPWDPMGHESSMAGTEEKRASRNPSYCERGIVHKHINI